MSFELNSNISIGTFKRVQVNDVKIEKSVHDFVDKATIKIPAKGRLKVTNDGTAPVIGETTVETGKVITEGLEVVIELGYNGSLKQEFVGFVSRVNFATPVEIECEGYSYQLRNITISKTFKATKLLAVLKEIIKGTQVTLIESKVPDVTVQKLVLQKHTGCEALLEVKKVLANSVSFFFTGKVLHAELFPLIPSGTSVKYKLGWNTIKDNELKLRQAKNQKVIVRYIGEKNDGTKVIAESGKDGEVKEFRTHGIVDAATLKKMADAQLSRMSYDGYEGKITTYLVPFAEPGMKAILTDEKYAERSGSYIVETVVTTYGTGGARRKVGIGLKL
jgi:hypothetical protein